MPTAATSSVLPSHTLREWLHQAARQSPQQPALVWDDGALNYADLLQTVQDQAKQLRQQGLQPGDRVAIAATRTPETIIRILAAVEAELAYVPLDQGYPADRIQAMLEQAQVRLTLGNSTGEAKPAPRSELFASEADLAYVLFTSGSTGAPKGVAMGQVPLAHLIDWHATHPRLGQRCTTLLFAPLSFDVHFQEIFSTVACQGTMVLIPEAHRRDPNLLHQALVRHQVTRLYLPYVALQMLAEADREQPALLTLQDVVSAGEQLQITPAIRALFQRLDGAVLHNHYGPTESHVVTAFELPADPASWAAIPPIGAALPHVQIALRDPETGAVTSQDEGELLLGGNTLAHGYLGQASLTHERFLPSVPGLSGRWYTTGDLVRRDAQGVLTYLGRADQQLKVDGFRIEPGEIEVALMTHPQVQDAVVSAPELPGLGRQLMCHLVLRHSAIGQAAQNPPLDAELRGQLQQHLRARLPEYMVPVQYMVLPRLPTTPSGKIDRRNLPLPAVRTEAAGQPLPPLAAIRQAWQELLGLPSVDERANVFDLGAKSLLVLRFVARLKELGHKVTVAQVYDRPTVQGLAGLLTEAQATTQARRARNGQPVDGIAIVGMAVRTAGSKTLDAFWDNLLANREGIRHFAPHELDPSVPQDIRSRPNFVAARGVLEDADRFDATFFGISAREATVLDPQQRLFLELCWTALEHASIDPAQNSDRFGVYAGVANNTYTPALRQENPELVKQLGEFGVMLGSEKDYVATRVANRLNLKGPALSIHTACSTSLVAVTQAWHGLASGQCDVALAGGMTVVVPQEAGYLHVEGGMESADGHCRPFDAKASGTLFASGGGVVVLKRLADAQADGDTIYGVIKGVGINNDGGDKASFTAPSVTGQAQAIRMALDHAGVSARSIGYVEAHGTGTALGDPIEVAALSQAWSQDTPDKQFSRIGSVKGHLGHLVAGAGVIGLIKTTLALHKQFIPGTLHFEQPNPNIDFGDTPFTVVGQATPWPREQGPRRAGVSSFGVGGTNAHVIVEEAPVLVASANASALPPTSAPIVWPLSARTEAALSQRMVDLADFVEHRPDLDSHAVLATLTRGRQAMRYRHVVVAASQQEACALMRARPAGRQALSQARLVYLFPGQGSQHPGMARGLYEQLPAFREALDRCLAIANPLLTPTEHGPADLLAWLTHADAKDPDVGALLAQTRYAQPALFSVSYALAAWLDSLGIRPAAMIGHSIGEYAAACWAGVMSLESALTAVIARGQAMFEQRPGAMLAVRAAIDAVAARLPADVEIAADNAPGLTVVAGDFEAIDALSRELEAQDIGTTRLKVSHAFHSASMEPALPRVAAALQAAALKGPEVPLYSCVTGTPLQAQQATDPQYWAQQVRATVQFRRAIEAELQHADTVFVEVGSAQALTALLRQFKTPQGKPATVVPLSGPVGQAANPALSALQGFGLLWSLGVDVAWPVSATAHRISLPTYPFLGERHWFQRKTLAPAPLVSEVAAPIQTQTVTIMSRLPRLQEEVTRIICDVSGLTPDAISGDATFVDMGLDSLSMTQATLEFERVFGLKMRFRRLTEDLDTLGKLVAFLDHELPADKFAPPPAVVQQTNMASAPGLNAAAPAMASVPLAPVAGGSAVHQLIQQQMQLMQQQLALLSGQPTAPAVTAALTAAQPVASANVPSTATAPAPSTEQADAQPGIKALVEKPFGASARIVLEKNQHFTAAQQAWVDDFIPRYNQRTGQSKSFSQAHRKVMSDPRVVTGFNPLWKDLVYPIVANRSKDAYIWDLDGNQYIDLLSCFGANLLGYQPDYIVKAMHAQIDAGMEIGPQHPLTAEVAKLMSDMTGMERVAFCNTGSEAVMGAMRIARTVTGRKKIAIFNNSYHGIFDEVIVRGTKQLRSLSAAPGILANAVENIIVLDWASDESLKYLREHGHELAAIMTEPIQNKYPNIQPREFVRGLREIADASGCALIFDEVVTGFRVARGGAQEFYGVRSDISTYGKVIGGGLPFAAIAGNSHWLDALDGGHWQYGDDSYPEAGVTYFAGTFVRHPLALASAKAALQYIHDGGPAFYQTLNDRTQRMIDRLNAAFAERHAPVKAVHCATLWRLAWDDNQRDISLFYYLARFKGLHLYEQFGHFVTDAMDDTITTRIADVFIECLDELMALGFITPRDGGSPPGGGLPTPQAQTPSNTSGQAPNALTQAPLTPGQTERWLAAAFDDGARLALNESFCVSLSGSVNVPALTQAMQDVLGRHEAFRVSFDLDEPRQILNPPAPIAVAEIDLRSQSDATVALDTFCSEASLRTFPLDHAPLAAASLLHLADGRKVVHVVASHLIFDGWASSVFNAELAVAYQARVAGKVPEFKPAESPLTFGLQEQARMVSADGKESLQYWQSVLSNPPALLSLGDRTPPQPRRYAADTLRARVNQVASLRDSARQRGATLFQWLLTAVSAVLHKASQQDEFVVSIPYAGQSLQRHGPLMADGVLDLPLRLSCQDQDTGVALLARVRNQLMDALEYPLATQGTVARALGLPSSGDRAPFTGVFFNLNPKVDLSGFAPLTAAMHEGRKRGTLNELFFNFYEEADGLTFDLHYSTEYFSPQRAQSLVDALLAVCNQWSQNLEQQVVQLPLTQPHATPQAPASGLSELESALLSWNQTDAPFDPHARVEQWIARQTLATPDSIAVQARGMRLSYRELGHRIHQFANLLMARGVGEGDRIGVCLSRGPDMIPALMGILQTGAAYVPLDPGFPKDRLQYMAEDAGVKWVITEAANAERSGVPRAQQIRVDDDAQLIQQAPTSEPQPLRPYSADATAYVIYTSGSTGKPKGVVLPQAAVCNFLASMKRQPGITDHDRLLAVTTLSFDIAVLELMLPLISGASVVLAQREDAMDGEALSKMIANDGITFMQATPTTWHLLLEAGWRAPQGFKALCGGEPLPPSLAEQLLAQGVELWNMYGPTETTVWSTVCRVADAKQKITIGLPIDNTQVWILDEQMRPCPIGAEGEICIGGKGVATGYFKRPELTADRFVRDPFSTEAGARLYRTGDLGRWRAEGTLEHLGRLDFQVKIRGYRIELGEIEARLAAQAGVARSVVVAREASPGDMQLVGYVTPQPGAAVDTAALRQALRADLPDYMVPQHILLLASLPLLPNGKIDRKALPAPAAMAQAPHAGHVQASSSTALASAHAATPSAPADPNLQRAIAHVMAEVLGLAQMGANDHFFELGGHSLLAAKLASRLIEVVGFRPALRAIFEAPTPAALAQALGHKPASDAQPSTAVIPIRADQTSAPLSQMQLRLWFLETLSPGTVAHNTPSGHLLHGPLDVAAFERAMQLLIERQSVLRTVIERTPEGARQRIMPSLAFQLPFTDLSELPAPEQQAALQTAVKKLVDTPYALERGPLFSAQLWRLSATEHAFFFQTHHLIWDGWSFDLFYQDISELYEACRTGRAPQLPAISVSYGDFAAWHQEWLSGPELTRQTDYWRNKLSPLPDPIELPLDRPRPAIMSGRGDCIQFNLGSQVTRALRAQAQRSGRTLYVTLLSAYTLALHQISQQRDFVVGTPVRGREQPGLEPLMGFFVNMLPMRMQIDPEQRMGSWLDQVHHMVVESFSYPEVPFEHLVRELNVPRDSSYSPIYQVSFSYQDARDRQTHWGNVEHDRMATPILGSAQDIGLWCVETADEIEFVFTYNTDVLDASTIGRLGARIEALLHQLEIEPDAPLHRYAVLPDSERQLIERWNQTLQTFDRHACAHHLIEAQVQRSPDAPAVLHPGWGQLSYRDLNGRANRLARVLRQRGIGRGSLVGLCVERGVDMLTAQLAVLKSGAAYVPLDPSYPTERLVYMSTDAELALLISEQSLLDVMPWPRDHQLLLDTDASEIAAQSDAPLPSRSEQEARPEDTAYVIYTSGSTGQPKGVMVPHRAVVNFLTSMAREPGLTAQDHLLAVTTLSFDIAVLELLLPLTVGAKVVLATRDQALDGRALQALIDSADITVMQATPATWHMLIEAGWAGHRGFKALVGGESLTPGLARQLLSRCSELWNMYGPTETTVWSTCARVDSADALITIGRPIANTQIQVLDSHGQRCPIGVPGEIYIGGDGVTLGYLKRPELSAERFLPDPFRSEPGASLYRTGDRGRWRPDGTIEHLGRLDFQVKVRGHRIELGEIETALAHFPGVVRNVVIVREDRPGDARLVAYIVPTDTISSAQALREHLRASLPDYMVPQHFVQLKAIPVLPNGKTDRSKLPAPDAALNEATHPTRTTHPPTPTENTLADIWRELLGCADINRDATFLDQGGHSLLLMRMLGRIETVFKVRISMREVFNTGTLVQVAKLIDDKGQGATQQHHRIAARHQPIAPLTAMQQRLLFIEQLQPGATTYHIPSAYRLQGPLNASVFDAAVKALFVRHPALRTQIEFGADGKPMQRVCDSVAASVIPAEDLSHLPSDQREIRLKERLRDLTCDALDYSAAPLARMRLFRLGTDEHVFFLMVHHLIADGRSIQIAWRDLSELYRAQLLGAEPKLPALGVTYGDFAAWHQHPNRHAETQRQVNYWHEVLSPVPEPLALPNDYPRPKQPSGKAKHIELHVPPATSQALGQLVTADKATLFMGALSAYALFLARHTGQNEFVIAIPILGRDDADIENVFGFFSNVLPIRLKIDSGSTYRQILAHVRESVVRAFEYPDAPLEEVIRTLRIERDESRSPIYQTLFGFQDVQNDDDVFANLKKQSVATPVAGIAEDLTCWMWQDRNGLKAYLTYATDLFGAETASLFAQRYLNLLDQVARSPDANAFELPMRSPAEQLQLDSWNATDTTDSGFSTINPLLARCALQNPSKTAVIQADGTHLTYAHLDARSNQLAHALRERGVGRGHLIGLCLERSLDLIVAQHAILKAGAAYVPLDPAYPVDRLTYMAQDADLSLLIAQTSTVAKINWPHDATLLLDGSTWQNRPSTALRPSQLDALASDPAYVIYTSGSTGKPKGVVVPHGAVVNFLNSMATTPGMASEDRILAITTLSFDIAVLELILPLTVGACIVMASQDQVLSGQELNGLLNTQGCTMMQATPSTWRMLIDAGWKGSPTFKALIGGEALTPDLSAALQARTGALWNMYGPTETTVWSSCWLATGTNRTISIGRPIANTQVHVLDDKMTPCPIGVPGEIWIGGHGVTTGYLKRPELTAERFLPDPFRKEPGARLYRTGDRGRWCPNGTIEHLGRLDFQVKVRGYRIELGEIESALAQSAEIARNVVIVREDEPGDQRLVAYIVPTRDGLGKHSFRDFLKERLPDYMVPQHFVMIESVPLLPNGKVNRQALPAPTPAVPPAVAHHLRLPQTSAEKAIASVWADLLKVPSIHTSDNFFDLGGHSLLAMRAVAEINKRLGTQLTVRQLIFSTLEQLALTHTSGTQQATIENGSSGKGWIRKFVDKLLP